MSSLKVYARTLIVAACLILGLSAKMSAHSHHVYVVEGHPHWHERVYVGHPWYHPDHVYVYDGYTYPNYYAGYPYYYYDPRYYYYDNYPTASVNLNVNLP